MQSADDPEFSSKFTVDLISFISASFGNDIDALSSGSIVYSLKSGISEILLEKFGIEVDIENFSCQLEEEYE